MLRSLAPLLQFLDNLQERASLEALEDVVASLEVDGAELQEYMRFSDRGYTRNLVRAGPWYHLLVLCWKNGQRSPIHDHAGSSCCVRVLRGVLTETRFEFAANGHVKAVGSHDLAAGAVCGSQDADMHQVSNLQPAPADLVTLHIYSPPLLTMGTYSLFDTLRGLEPMFVTFNDAAGI